MIIFSPPKSHSNKTPNRISILSNNDLKKTNTQNKLNQAELKQMKDIKAVQKQNLS